MDNSGSDRDHALRQGLAPLKSVLGKHGRDNETSLEKDGAARTLGLRTDLDAPKQQSIVEEEDRPSSGSLMDSLPQMMYGFGDEKEPLPETVACMQELVSEYIRHVTDEACRAASMKGRLDTECFMFAVRRDRAKYKRGREILELNEHIKGCTRMRLTSQNMDAFTPTFRPQPRVRAVAKLSNLSALQDDETEEPLLTSSSSETSGSCLSSDSEGEAGK